MARPLLIYLLSFFFLGITYYQENLSLQPRFFFAPKSTLIKKLETKISLPKEEKALFFALVLGEKRLLSRKIRKEFSSLMLQHLLVPSGLHLSSFLLLPYFFRRFRFLKKLPEATLISLAPLFFVSGFFSLKRMLLFRFLMFLPGTFSCWKLFWLTFLGNSLLGWYAASPLSAAYSFLFWGVLVSSQDIIYPRELLLRLFLAQTLALFFQQEAFSLLAFPSHFLFSLLFPFFFPLLLILALLSFLIPGAEVGLGWMLQGFLWASQKAALMAQLGPYLWPSLLWVVVGALAFHRKLYPYLILGLMLLTLFYSAPLGLKEKSQVSQPNIYWRFPRPEEIAQSRKTKTGLSLKLKSGRRCFLRGEKIFCRLLVSEKLF